MLISYTTKELDLIARIMRAEALSDGNLAMLMVGNVIVNRVIASCDVFKSTYSITKVINQKNAFSSLNSSLFQKASTTKEQNLAKRVLRGEYYYPATHALWFYNPGKNSCKNNWYGQEYTGKYKSHCFYSPSPGFCDEIR